MPVHSVTTAKLDLPYRLQWLPCHDVRHIEKTVRGRFSGVNILPLSHPLHSQFGLAKTARGGEYLQETAWFGVTLF